MFYVTCNWTVYKPQQKHIVLCYVMISHTMIHFRILVLLNVSWGNFYNSLVRDIKNDKLTSKAVLSINDQQQCQSLLGHAWQCWARFGNSHICSDIIHQAWQCSGQGVQVHFQAFNIVTEFHRG